ncbi:MAG: SDR family NAD(P)-dependent oxidoreductase [Planctomycetota bacterium]|jgi:NAD(P)-dependent dehydrogenase (short-subunit alcohol dehydrogenase family)
MQLNEKIALITGGTKGIGAATAILLARQGADVAIVGRHQDEQAITTKKTIESAGRKCLIVTADMSKADDAVRCVNQTNQHLGSLDVLVHCAGGNVTGGLLEVTPETWREGFDVHVHAVFHLCRTAVPIMRKKKAGAIVLISSVAGTRSLPSNIGYQVVKGAIIQFTRGLAREFARDNIRVNAVAPGVIRTDFHKNMTAEQKKLNLDQRIPLQREGTPQQVAELIGELVTNDYITGQTVTIDGGLTMRIA